MQVIVIFEFNGLDPNSERADQIIDEISKSCETMRKDFDADACFIDDAKSD
jgi:hypothetical protein